MPTVLEYLTAVLMETIFHTSWWDYSKNRFNFQGRICLGASLGWGVFTVALFYVLHPFVEWIVSLYSAAAGKILVCAAGALYIADFCISFANAMQIGKRLRSMDEVMDSIYEFVQSSKLYESVEELRGRLASYPLSEYGPSFGNAWRPGGRRHCLYLGADAGGAGEQAGSLESADRGVSWRCPEPVRAAEEPSEYFHPPCHERLSEHEVQGAGA